VADNIKTENNNSQKDSKLILNFIAKLNIFRKNMRIYPLGHNTILSAGDTLSTMLYEIFMLTPSITINAIKHHLLVNGKLLDSKYIHVNNIAIFISHLGIASLTLTKDITSKELELMFQLTMKIPPRNHIYQHKDILNEINSLDHIRLRAIDLSSVKFIDEDITDNSETGAQLTIWQKLMLGCLSPELLEIRDEALLKTIKIYDQGSINTFLQDFNIPEDRLIESYRTVLNNHFQIASEQEKEFLEKQEFFRSMHNAFYELPQELKEQILSATFDTINNAADEKILEEILQSMPGDLVIEILSQAVLNKKVMSPMLIKLLSVLYRAGKQTQEAPGEKGSSNNPVWDRIAELFNREGYEKYLSEEYADQLQSFSLGSDSGLNSSPIGFASKKHITALQEQSVNRHLTSALLFLMEGNIEEHIYSDYADKISQIIPDLLGYGDYRHLVTIYTTLRKQMEIGKGPVAYDAAEKTLNIFSDDSFTSKLAHAYNTQANGQNRAFEELIMVMGVKNLPWLIDQFLKQRTVNKAHQIYSLICRFGPEAAEAALAKLPQSDGEQLIALLKLIRGCSDAIPSAQIRQLLKNKKMEVRLEVIKILIKQNDPDAIIALRELLRSRDIETAFKAMKIIHDYKVQELVQELAMQIKTFYISRSAFARNKTILTLLGSLGNVKALPALQKIAGARLSLSPRLLRQTREHLYKTLVGYPRSATEGLVRQGLLSKDNYIVGICEKLGSTGKSYVAKGNSSFPN